MKRNEKLYGRSEESWIELYRDMSERWQNLSPEQYMAPMGTRLLAVSCQLRGIDFDGFVRLVSGDIPAAMLAVRERLEHRHNFLVEMMAKHQVDPTEMEEVARGLAEELAAIDSPQGCAHLTAFLERVVKRHWHLEQITEKVLH